MGYNPQVIETWNSSFMLKMFNTAIIRHILIILVCTLLLTASEQLYRYYFGISPLTPDKLAESGLINCCFIILFRFARFRTIRVLMFVFFAIATIGNHIHYAVYESWITGMNIYLFFKEFSEVTHAGIPMLGSLMPVIIWGVVDCCIFLIAGMRRTKRIVIADLFFIALFAFIIARSFFTLHQQGLSPRYNYGQLKSAYFSLGYSLGKIIPYDVFELSDVPLYEHKTPQKLTPKIKNIILIVGESESAAHLDIFGYERETSPFIRSLKDNELAIVKSGYAAGFGTSVALPFFFNAIPYPNGLNQIYSGKTNLLNLAQQQNYKTFFHSAQAENEMALINLIGRQWIDVLTYPTHSGYKLKESMPDNNLLPLFNQINLDEGNNFVVLHHRGSHAPYGDLLSDEQQIFGHTTQDKYDNTIYNTDQFIKTVFEQLQQRNNDDWLLIYTSDHGQYVTPTIANQGTDQLDNYWVPFVLYTPNAAIAHEMKNTFASCERTRHQQLATFIINVMGYAMPIADCNEATVNRTLTGDVGYLHIDIKQDKKEWIYPKK